MISRRAGEGRLIAFRGASIVRKADATETGGRWAFGEATQPPGFENSPHSHSEPEAFYVLDGDFVLYGSGEPTDLDSGCFVLIPAGEIHGFRAGAHGGRFLAIWPAKMDGYFEEMIAAVAGGLATPELLAKIGHRHGMTGHGTLPTPGIGNSTTICAVRGRPDCHRTGRGMIGASVSAEHLTIATSQGS